MKLKRNELLEVLTELKPGIADKAIVDQLTHFVFKRDSICTYNDRIFISVNFSTGIDGSIASHDLYSIVSKIKEDTFTITQKKNKIFLKSDTVSAELDCKGDIEIDPPKIPDKAKWKPFPKDLFSALSLCCFSTSRDMSTPELTGIFVDGVICASSDDIRISGIEISKRFPTVLIPLKSVIELVKFNTLDKYCINKDGIFFTDGDIVFFSKLLSYEWPIGLLDNFEFEGIRVSLPEGLKSSIEIVSVMSEVGFDIDKSIEVNIKNNKIKLKASKSSGWVEVNCDIKYNKKEIQFAINPDFLIAILDKTNIMKVGSDRALFIADKFKHLVSLNAMDKE